jgi:uncharacterized coiled-coil protein SlyX
MAQPVLTVAGHDRPSTGQEPERPMVPLAEAAALSGKHPEALRSMVRRGQLAARRDNRGGWLVAAPQPAEAGSGPADDRPLTNLEDAIAELRDELAGLREALGRSEAGREAAVAQARAEGEARAAKGEAEAAAQRELVDELKRLLADARRPWWRRLVG